MKKNTLLYILLFFLIAVNGFFLFNHLGGPRGLKQTKDPMFFVFKQLDFNEEQLAEVKTLNVKHEKDLNKINDRLRQLKDQLFSNLHKNQLDARLIDSITALIGENEKERDKVVFYHFKSIQELCDEKQKEKFKAIIKDAIRQGSPNGQQPPHPREQSVHRPPRG